MTIDLTVQASHEYKHTDFEKRTCYRNAVDGVWRWTDGEKIERCRMDHLISRSALLGELDGAPIGGGLIMGPELSLTGGIVAAKKLTIEINDHLPTTTEGLRIADMIPKILGRFFKNNTKYARAQSGHDLGAKGIIPDLNRKTSVLIDRLWYEGEVVGEPTVEVIDDLIGHLLLMRDKITQEEGN